MYLWRIRRLGYAKIEGILQASFLLILVSSPNLLVAYAQEPDDNQIALFSSDETVAFKIYSGLGRAFGVGDPDKQDDFRFTLINAGSNLAKGRIVASSMIIEEESRILSIPSFIASEKIHVSPDDEFELQANGTRQFVVEIDKQVLDELLFDEAIYTGHLLVLVDGSDPVTIGIKISFKDDPWTSIIFALCGIVIAIATGFKYTNWEKAREIEEKTEDDEQVVSHINGHIRSINFMRGTVNPSAWQNIRDAHAAKVKKIDEHVWDIDLDDEAEAVKWFEVVDNQLREQNLNRPNETKDNVALAEIEMPRKDDYDNRKRCVIECRINDQKDANKKDRKKTVYLLAVGVVASFVVTITESSFLGNSWVNGAVAVAIGFGTYRAQDILKIIPRGEE